VMPARAVATAWFRKRSGRAYRAVRETAGLMDFTMLRKVDIDGPGALELVNTVVTRDVSQLTPGKIAYGALADEDGKMVDDCTVMREMLQSLTDEDLSNEVFLYYTFREDVEVARVVNGEELKMMQASLESVRVTDAVVGYCVDLVRATREHDNALIGSSPRGALALLSCSRAIAVIDGRDYVTPDDVKQIAQPVLAHRLRVKPQLWMTGLDGDSIVAEVLQVVPVPDVSVPDADTGLGC